jgi:hypothetical protein
VLQNSAAAKLPHLADLSYKMLSASLLLHLHDGKKRKKKQQI